MLASLANKNLIKSKFYSGTSGLVLPVPRTLYPAEFQGASRLKYYSSLFNSVEINSSFYKMPMVSTINKWINSVPDGFQFTFKLSKAITHSKGLNFNTEDLANFMQTIAYAGNKKGCLLIQFPPALKIEMIKEVEKLLIEIYKTDPQQLWKVAIEFRNLSWYHNDVYDLLAQHNASLVIHDLPASSTLIMNVATSFVYLRFHGPGGRYRGSYDDDFLYQHAEHIKAWISAGKTIYCYFNNTMGDAVKNLTTLNNLVRHDAFSA